MKQSILPQIKTKGKAVWQVLKNTDRPRWFDLLLVIPIAVFCFFSFQHSDLLCTASHGRDMLDCILSGNFLSFYDYTRSTAVYSITIYLAFAIWSIPVKLIYVIFGLTPWEVTVFVDMPYAVSMWYKLLPTLAYLAIGYLIYKILLEIKVNESTAKWACYLFLASPIAMFSQFVFGQYDSLGLFFTVLALYMFIKKKFYLFSVFCSIAITFKMFALIFFFPLILLAEKRILHIAKYTVIAFAGYVLCAVPFLSSTGYQYAMGFSGGIIMRLFDVGINTAMGNFSFFTFAMIILCVYAYTKKAANDADFHANAIYLAFLIFGVLFAFIVLWHPQWVLFLTPFMAMAFVLNRNSNTSLILMIAMGLGYLLVTIRSFPGNVDANMMNSGIFAQIFGVNPSVPPIRDLLGITHMQTASNVALTCFVGSILILFYFYSPLTKNGSLLEENSKKGFFVGDRIFLWALPLLLVPFILCSLVAFF